jgi:GAF domain-containing protein
MNLLELIGLGGPDPMEIARQHQLTDADLERFAHGARVTNNQQLLAKIAEMRQRYGYDKQTDPNIIGNPIDEPMTQRNRLAQFGRNAVQAHTNLNDALLTRQQ